MYCCTVSFISLKIHQQLRFPKYIFGNYNLRLKFKILLLQTCLTTKYMFSQFNQKVKYLCVWSSQGCLKDTLKCQGCIKGVSRVYQRCLKSVSRSEGCHKSLSQYCFCQSVELNYVPSWSGKGAHLAMIENKFIRTCSKFRRAYEHAFKNHVNSMEVTFQTLTYMCICIQYK